MGYAIRDWGEHFETAESRKLKRLPWVRIPVKLDGWGYASLIDHKDGPAHFGCWIALVELAAICKPRGVLTRPTGEPMTLHDISRLTRVPMAVMEAAITRLVAMGWVESPDNLPLSPDVSGESPGNLPVRRENPPDTVRDVTERDVTGERTLLSAKADAGVLLVQKAWNENRGPLPEAKALGKDRHRLCTLMAKDAGRDEALLASSAAAFAMDPFNRERRYGIETWCRHRSKWLDAGRNGYTPPAGNGNGRFLSGKELFE